MIWKSLALGLDQDNQGAEQWLLFRCIFAVVPAESADTLIMFVKGENQADSKVLYKTGFTIK